MAAVLFDRDAFLWAVCNDKAELVDEMCLQCSQADPNLLSQALTIACGHDYICVRTLLAAAPHLELEAVERACRRGLLRVVMLFENILERSVRFWTRGLSCALDYGHLAVASFLLEKQHTIDKETWELFIFKAAEGANPAATALVLQRRQQDWSVYAALRFAAENDLREIVKLLIPHSTSKQRKRAFHKATIAGAKSALAALAADVSQDAVQSSVGWALWERHYDIFIMLWRRLEPDRQATLREQVNAQYVLAAFERKKLSWRYFVECQPKKMLYDPFLEEMVLSFCFG